MYLSLKKGKVIKVFKFMVKNWQSFHCLSSDIRIAKVRDNCFTRGQKLMGNAQDFINFEQELEVVTFYTHTNTNTHFSMTCLYTLIGRQYFTSKALTDFQFLALF